LRRCIKGVVTALDKQPIESYDTVIGYKTIGYYLQAGAYTHPFFSST
jgi:hypothetical protein